MKIDAVSFSWAGDKYLGTPYSRMDCQAFVERCMADTGLRMDLGGSNSWYREIRKNGWVGTPEDCARIFGVIPKGALLFILEDVGPGTPEKFRRDGIGDATHIGIVTGRGEGAIHSSSSRGCVAESKFQNRTIPNGGWNRVGLYNKFSYGKSVDWILDHIGIGEDPAEQGTAEEEKHVTATVYAENGKPVNLRKSADKSAALLDIVPVGTDVEIIGSTHDRSGKPWSKIKVNGKTGWMMTEFLVTDESAVPADDEGQPPDNPDGKIALLFHPDELRGILPILENMTEQIVNTIGRG